MGQHLSRMATVFEEIEWMLHLKPSETVAGVDSLPVDRRVRAIAVLNAGTDYLGAFPRHVVTRELVKNALLAQRMGRTSRVVAIHLLIESLVTKGVALDPDEFVKSYA